MFDVFDCAVSAWSDAKPSDADSVRIFVDRLGHLADQSTNITLLQVGVDDPYDFRCETRRHNVDMRAEWTRLGEYADSAYVQSSLVPSYLDVRESSLPSIDTVRARIQDVFAIYDRLLLPFGGNKRRADFLLSFTRTRLVIPLAQRFHPLSGEDSMILSLLAQGQARTAVAARLRLSVRMVNSIVDRLCESFGASTETQLISMAIAQELVRTR